MNLKVEEKFEVSQILKMSKGNIDWLLDIDSFEGESLERARVSVKEMRIWKEPCWVKVKMKSKVIEMALMGKEMREY